MFVDHAKQSATYRLKPTLKRAIQNTAEATGELTANKISNKITKSQNLHRRIAYRQLKMKQKI